MKPRIVDADMTQPFLKKSRKEETSTASFDTHFLAEPPKLVRVSAAAIVNLQGEVLLARRPEGKQAAGLWEFPGGKIENDEMPEYALVRELKEELNIDVDLPVLQPINFTTLYVEENHMNLVMYLYKVPSWSGEIKALEHSNIAWVPATKLLDYVQMMPAADVPLAEFIVNTNCL